MTRSHPAALLATFFGIGHLPVAPGTWAAIVALPLGWVLITAGGATALAAGILALTALGVWAANRYAYHLGIADPSHVVIDEVVGQWIVLLVAPHHPVAYLAAFLLFRAFDIGKPWPVSWIDRRVGGGVGIMLDDMAASAYACIALLAGLALWRAFSGG